jgi:conserved hypothetical protein, ribA/ribD-fused
MALERKGGEQSMVYSLEDLCNHYRKGKTYHFLFFWGHTPAKDGSITKSCLSQWWMQDFTVDEITYTCAEQYMMAEKARLFQDDVMLEKIILAKQPKEMKAYGRQVKNFDAKVWEDACYTLVLKGNLAKFGQNEALLGFLLTTQNRILVEASPYDQIWGIGMRETDPNAGNPLKWQGKNLLGFALTEARDMLSHAQ